MRSAGGNTSGSSDSREAQTAQSDQRSHGSVAPSETPEIEDIDMAIRQRRQKNHEAKDHQGPQPGTGVQSEGQESRQGRTGATPSPSAIPRTRISAAWTAVAIGIVLLIALLIFIFQNLHGVRVSFVTLHGSFPLALSLLCAALAGAVVVFLVGVSRIAQLRRTARRQRDTAVAATTAVE